MDQDPVRPGSARIPRPRISERLGPDWFEANQPDVVEGHLTPLDILDKITERLGMPRGCFYDDYVSEAAQAGDILEAATRMQHLGLPWQRVVHAYLIAAVRASHESLAAAAATHATRILIGAGHPRAGLRLLSVLLRMAPQLPNEDRDGFLTQWHSLRGWARYRSVELAPAGSMSAPAAREALQAALEAYQSAWSVPGASPTYRAMAAYNIGSILLRQEHLTRAGSWLRRAQDLLAEAGDAFREDLAIGIRLNLAFAAGMQDPGCLTEEREFLEAVIADHCRSDASWNENVRAAALVLLAIDALGRGRFGKAVAYANRVKGAPWQGVHSGMIAATAFLLLGRIADARRRADETIALADRLPGADDLSYWRSQCLVVRILCDMVERGDGKLDSRFAQELYDSVRAWPPDGPRGDRRASLLAFVHAAQPESPTHLPLFPEWLVLTFLTVPDEAYRTSPLARTMERNLTKG